MATSYLQIVRVFDWIFHLPTGTAADGTAPAGDAAQAGASATEQATGASGQQPQEDDEMEGIDPEFFAALPPELQEEVLEQQRRERQRRRAAAEREAAAQVCTGPMML